MQCNNGYQGIPESNRGVNCTERALRDSFEAAARPHTLEVVESGFRNFAAVKEEFLLRPMKRLEVNSRSSSSWMCRVVSNRSGGGSLDRFTLFVLLPLVVFGTGKFGTGEHERSPARMLRRAPCGKVIGQLRHCVQTGYIVSEAGDLTIPRSDSYSVQAWR